MRLGVEFLFIMTTKQEILQYLQNEGWSDLIDSRWKDKLKEIIKTKFPDVEDPLLEEIFTIILI